MGPQDEVTARMIVECLIDSIDPFEGVECFIYRDGEDDAILDGHYTAQQLIRLAEYMLKTQEDK